jgi:glycosyltransferase involved in cell wall biosynthesis
LGLVRSRAPALTDRLRAVKQQIALRGARRSAMEGDPRRTNDLLQNAIIDARRRLGAAAPADLDLLEECERLDPRRRRVLHVVGGLGAGGAERQLVATVAGLREQGFTGSAILVTDDPGDPRGAYRARLDRAGIAPTIAGQRLDRAFSSRLAIAPQLRQAAKAIPALLRPRCSDLFGEFVARRPHLVHCWLDHTNIWGGVAAVLAGVPAVVLSARSVAPTNFPLLHEPWLAPWYSALLERPGVLLANNSHAGAADYARWLSIDRHRITVILNGVDLSPLAEVSAQEVQEFRRSIDAGGRDDDDQVLTGILRLGEEKRPEVFIRVAQHLVQRFERLQVALVGGGPMERQIRSMIASGPAPQRIHLLGRRQDVPVILAASSLLMLTSRMEGTPNVLLEAQHFGCPVVTTAAGGAVDAVLDGVTGLVRPVDDVEGLTAACSALLADHERRRRMSEAGRRFVAERFGQARMLEETLALHARAIAEAIAAARHEGPGPQ